MQEVSFKDNEFFIKDDSGNYLAVIKFSNYDDKTITIDHTFVDPSLRGQGIAFKLVLKVVELARLDDLKIIPICSYSVNVLNSLEYQDVLRK